MEELKKFAEKFTAEHSIDKYNIEIEGEVAKNENYIGEVIFFNISTETGPSYHFIRKKVIFPEQTNANFAYLLSSQREIHIYSVIFPVLKEFLRRQEHQEALNIVPKIYHIEEEERQGLIILENMKHAGYRMMDKSVPMNEETMSLVVETYAKLHSISFAFKELEPVNFKKATKDLKDVWTNFKTVLGWEKYFKPLLKDALRIVEEKNGGHLVSKFKNILDDIENVVYMVADDGDKLVICHGDAWNNNMLLKTDEQGHPQAVCLIDFQMSTISTPILDLSYLLLSAADKDILENLEKYLELYHEKLSNFLISYGIDVQKIFSFEKLMAHWKKYSKAGLVIALFIIQVSLSEMDEVPEDLKELTFEDSSKMKNVEIYRERINNLMVNYANKFL